MKRKVIAFFVISVFCISSFSFAGEEDFPIALKVIESHSNIYESIIEWK